MVIAALVLSAAVFAFLRYSTPGRAMRAIASSPHTAPLVGIDVRKYSAVAFATGASLAAVAGILLSSFRTVNPTMGAEYTLNALIVIVMGGIGNVAGGLAAALILGLTQTLANMLGQSALGTVIVFAAFAAVLLWRPHGLFGSARSTGARGGFRLPKEAVAVAALGALVAVPYVADAYWLLLAINILTYVALATAWAFFSGPTRYVSLAASAFYGLGAYCVAVLASDHSYPVALIAAVGFSVVLSAIVGLATLRLSGMYFVIFTFGLASLVSAAVTWWEFNVAKSSGWYVFLLHHRRADLLPAARAVRAHRRPLALARPHPHGLRAEDAGRRRDGGAPDRHQHGGLEGRHLRGELGGDGAGRRHPGPEELLCDGADACSARTSPSSR